MPKVIVYSTDPCSFCARAKDLLDKRGVAYEEINLAKDPAGREQLFSRTGMLSFPQIVVGDDTLGGFRELLMADQNGHLAELAA